MPRTARLHSPGSVTHLVSRFVGREFRFHGDSERAEYLRRVPAALRGCGATPIAWALMSSHPHWNLLAGDVPLSRFMQSLHGGFAQWLNRRHDRIGPVFSERFRSLIVPEERRAWSVAYTHNNPVRAGVVDDPADSDWTSHRAYIGEAEPPPWFDVVAALHACGFSATPAGRQAFHDFVVSRARETRGDLERLVVDTRVLARRELGAPVELSDAVMREDGILEQPVVVLGGVPLRPRWDGPVDAVLDTAARTAGVSASEIRGRARSHALVEVRRVALLAWTLCLGRPQREMSDAIGVSAAAASQLRGRASLASIARARAVAEECLRARPMGCTPRRVA